MMLPLKRKELAADSSVSECQPCALMPYSCSFCRLCAMLLCPVCCCDAEHLYALCSITERSALPHVFVRLLLAGQRPSGCAGGDAEPSCSLQPHAGAQQQNSFQQHRACAWMHRSNVTFHTH
jgi:hypothetical protein